MDDTTTQRRTDGGGSDPPHDSPQRGPRSSAPRLAEAWPTCAVWNVERQTTVGELVEGGRQVRYFFAMTNVETSPDYSGVISRIVPGRMTCEAERTWGARFEPVAIQVCAGRALRLVDAIPTPPDLEELPVLAGWLGARPLNDLRAFLVKSEGLAGH